MHVHNSLALWLVYVHNSLALRLVHPKSKMKSAAALILTLVATVRAQDCPTTWTCAYTTTPPTLDADVSDWNSVDGITTSLLMITGETYADGDATFKCVYDDELIYFALEIPGVYRFSDTVSELCAAIATMMKIGSQATFVNMGGCPLMPSRQAATPDHQTRAPTTLWTLARIGS